jgi:glycosyltransferase involved in cell wall biosynthesis
MEALTEISPQPLILSVIVPVRNEQESLPACLQSILTQSEPGFALGEEWELILVDDASTDQTPAILAAAAAHPGVTVFSPGDPAAAGLTGKNNACWTGVQAAQGRLLLFTDADTIHTPGNISRARHELEKYDVALLSYSPQQLTTGILQRMLMPLIFAELAIAYPPAQVNDPASRVAAANGQFILVEGAAYFAVGGHRALGLKVLEDVALAHNIKRAKNTIRFRYAPDALSTRMYRTTAAMIEGWTKNLALLFPHPILMALTALLVFALAIGLPILALVYPFFIPWQRAIIWLVWLRGLWGFFSRVSKSHFPIPDRVLALFGMPIFAWLLLRSYIAVRISKHVQWKGRTYST